jgi:hypothetical protein
MSWDAAGYAREVRALMKLAEARGKVLAGVDWKNGRATGTFEPKRKAKAQPADTLL